MPMLLLRFKPDDITGVHIFDWSALTLNPAEAFSDEESLAERVCVLGRACARLKSDGRAGKRTTTRKGRIDPDSAGKPFGRSFNGGFETRTTDIHT